MMYVELGTNRTQEKVGNARFEKGSTEAIEGDSHRPACVDGFSRAFQFVRNRS